MLRQEVEMQEGPRILQFNTYDTGGGAAFAAYDLHRNLIREGVYSRLAVQLKSRDDKTILGESGWRGWATNMYRACADFLPFAVHCGRWKKSSFSSNAQRDRWAAKMLLEKPDLVHVHWIGGGFLRPETIGVLKKPVVWTMHDAWPFTGGCHYPRECERYRLTCGACPALGSTLENDLSRKNWQRKMTSWGEADITVVAPSRWLAGCARASSLFSGRRIEVIPNGLDLELFRPRDRREGRMRLGLPEDRLLIGFAAVWATNNYLKGSDLLTDALRRMLGHGPKNPPAAVICGHSQRGYLGETGVEAFRCGILDRESLPWFYSAVDVFVVPSRQDNLPFTAMEALACGTPCVAFDTAGMPDLVDHMETGYLARPFEVEDMARGIEWVLEDSARRTKLGTQARTKCEDCFSVQTQLKRYRQLYAEVLRSPLTRPDGQECE